MLTDEDTPTIRNAIYRRLDNEPGVKICEIKFAKGLHHIAVGVLASIDDMDDGPITRSVFDLPIPFEHSHLVEEIDQIAEQLKAARKAHYGSGGGLILTPERQLVGTGRRGLWARYGLNDG
jgi:hypothetical protein